MNAKPLRLIFAGGGTGGHLFPAIAVADEIKRRYSQADITFVGTAGKIEARVVPARGYPFVSIWISGFRRTLSLQTLLLPVKVVVSLIQSLILLLKKKPNAVVGTGGYVCGPVVYSAQLLGLPTVIQEQNSYPGATTRFLARHAREVHVAFEASRKYLKRQDNVRVSGNPTREVLGTVRRADAAVHFGIDPEKKTILVFGGSLGAASINAVIGPVAVSLAREGIQTVWQTGAEDFAGIKQEMMQVEDMVKVHEFIERMEMAYAACDMAVCRSGASSLAELARVGVPAVLVPYPFAAADHQTANAKTMMEVGAAVMVADRDAPARLPAVILELVHDPQRLEHMATAARRLGKPEATSTLADAVLRAAHW